MPDTRVLLTFRKRPRTVRRRFEDLLHFKTLEDAEVVIMRRDD